MIMSKHTLFRPLIALFVVATLGAPAFADWKKSFDGARKALQDKDFRTAEGLALEALNETEGLKPTDDRKLNSLRLLADVYRQTRQWAAAVGLLDQVVAAYTTLGIEESPDAGNLWNELGVSHHQMKDYDKAEAAYARSLAIKRKKFKDNVASIAIVVTNLGELYRRKKDWPKAEELHKQAISDKENELGPDSVTLIASLNNLALVHKEQKRYDEAKALLDRAIALATAGEDKGKNADHGTALSNLGDVYASQSKHAEAKVAFEQALALRKEVLGPEHPHVAETLGNLANSLTALGLFDDAIVHYDQSIALYKLEYGATDSRATRTMANKAMALDRAKRPEDAKAVREDIKRLEERKNQPTP